ncbi:serine--tRNA synthetase-like protein Slimp isoform X2 [Eurytemora carolleeae]|uniref:serine--tRNA synthetase-like protein Slimp isoform X2 n=1 Tax=Eurytemora carolleeae TaxID=1294199 RepID=UPI000C77A9D6|nr:serine--tRNA synthetase-like protein Slimp isoform X2 [Eurytemora carolleeae]|eukprot:XP_023341350.1 serine--tRNA synthetase-like protein Slimp isoform X2 [Eurytemora affinis]
MLVYEDKSIPDYLNLPNTSPHTPLAGVTPLLTDRILFESDPVILDLKNTTRTPLTHEQIIEEQNLAEFSNVSHTAVYLLDKLSKLELKLSRQFQDKLLYLGFKMYICLELKLSRQFQDKLLDLGFEMYICLELKLSRQFQDKLLDLGFEMFSNPDFSKSVLVEGCGSDLSGSDLFNLTPMQDFGDKESCNAMYLVGGASVEPFAAYFARNLLLTPAVLPLNLFSIGRKYNPVHKLNTRSLLEQQQCTAVQFFSVSQSEENMNLELENMKELLMDLLVGFGQLRILENSGEGLQRREGRRFSFQLLLPVSHQYIEIGNISVENDYYSKRLMIKQKVGDSFRNVWTLSGTVANITKLLTILLETDSHLINEKN